MHPERARKHLGIIWKLFQCFRSHNNGNKTMETPKPSMETKTMETTPMETKSTETKQQITETKTMEAKDMEIHPMETPHNGNENHGNKNHGNKHHGNKNPGNKHHGIKPPCKLMETKKHRIEQWRKSASHPQAGLGRLVQRVAKHASSICLCFNLAGWGRSGILGPGTVGQNFQL